MKNTLLTATQLVEEWGKAWDGVNEVNALHNNEGMRPASKEVPEITGKYRAVVDENGAVHGRIPVQ